ncbi:hypothetical protein [Streptomyces sp. NPDC059631]|uniref:hypothetical protein n=1 Tax=unclassified Streptomyces TaxID=2593676 RepID=UPI00369FE6EE
MTVCASPGPSAAREQEGAPAPPRAAAEDGATPAAPCAITVDGAYAARLTRGGGSWYPERWTLDGPEPYAVPLPAERPEEPGTEVQPMGDGRVLVRRLVAGRHTFSLLYPAGSGTGELSLGAVECPDRTRLRLLPCAPGGERAYALAVGPLTSAVWLVAGAGIGPELLAEVPGRCSGGVWLDRSGRLLALDRWDGGRTKTVVVDLVGGEVTPLLQIAPHSDDRLLLADPDSGLLLIRSDAPSPGRARLGWGVLGSTLPVRFPSGLEVPDCAVTPFAVQAGQVLTPEQCAVALRYEGAYGSWIGVWRPAERRVRHLPAPEGWLPGAGVWTGDGALRLPFSTGAVPCGVARWTAPGRDPGREAGSPRAALPAVRAPRWVPVRRALALPSPAGAPDGGPGVGPGAGPGTGPGAGPGTGPGAGPDTGPGAGLGAGPGTGPGAGPDTGPGTGPGAELAVPAVRPGAAPDGGAGAGRPRVRPYGPYGGPPGAGLQEQPVARPYPQPGPRPGPYAPPGPMPYGQQAPRPQGLPGEGPLTGPRQGEGPYGGPGAGPRRSPARPHPRPAAAASPRPGAPATGADAPAAPAPAHASPRAPGTGGPGTPAGPQPTHSSPGFLVPAAFRLLAPGRSPHPAPDLAPAPARAPGPQPAPAETAEPAAEAAACPETEPAAEPAAGPAAEPAESDPPSPVVPRPVTLQQAARTGRMTGPVTGRMASR